MQETVLLEKVSINKYILNVDRRIAIELTHEQVETIYNRIEETLYEGVKTNELI